MACGSKDKRGATNGVSTPSVTTTTISLLPNLHSFNNFKERSQDFTHTTIKSPAIGHSFNKFGSGSQTFREAEIRCAEESSQQSIPIRRSHSFNEAHCTILHSFNNKGKGTQCFDGFKLN